MLHKTPGVAPHPLAVHPRVPEEVREKIRQTLLQLGKNPTGQALLARIPIKKIGEARMADYTALEKFRLEQYYVK